MGAMLGCVVLGLAGVIAVVFGTRRTAGDVAQDLRPDDAEGDSNGELRSSVGDGATIFRRAFGAARGGLLVGTALGALMGVVLGGPPTRSLILACTGLAGGYMWQSAQERARAERRRHAIDFHLPLVMESIVIAVEAGADVLGALRRVVEINSTRAEGAVSDPVTALLSTVIERTDRGSGLEETLRDVAERSDVISVRHALLHLALAHREGGELVRPLRELGNSTQVYFQETVEERIAKIPVKATAPLVCTFTGLIICFITVPLLQVSSMTKRALPSDEAPRIAQERGAMTLFLACCIVPILLLLGTLTLDLRTYTVESGARQRILDEAVLEGVRALPRPDVATQLTRRYLERFGFVNDVDVRATPRSVSVLHDGMTSFSLLRLFGIDLTVPYTLYARARSRPVDAVIALDLGRSLAPAPGNRWGVESEWGAAAYFVERAGRFDPPRDPLALTVRCFNPIVSALKLGAIRVHDYLAAFGDARIGVGIYPGNGYDFELVRPFGEEEAGRVALPRYEGQEIRSEDCARAAIAERWYERYRFPSNRYGGAISVPEPLLTQDGEFNPIHAPYLTVDEAIWMSPVREESPFASGYGNLAAVLEGVFGTLVGAPDLTTRGGFGVRPRRIGIVFSADLPHVGAERFPNAEVQERIDAVIDRYRPIVETMGTDIRIYLVMLTSPDTVLDAFARSMVRDFFAARSGVTAMAAIEIVPIFPVDSDDLLTTIVPAILLDRSSGGIAR